MTLSLVFILLLLGHVLGDFYFQTNKMAENKDGSWFYLILHSLVYCACMCGVLFLGISVSWQTFCFVLAISGIHAVIDLTKNLVFKKLNRSRTAPGLAAAKKYIFIFDQLLHIAALAVLSATWGVLFTVRPLLGQDIVNFPAKPVLILLGLLTVLKPVGIIIGKGIIWDFSEHHSPPDDTQKNAGRMIGYLERIIVFVLLLYKQYGAIGFVLAAKSVARFKEIENNRSTAEYYLIGTLLSVTSVFVVAFVLGLLTP